MVVAQREGHHLVERQLALAEARPQLRRDARQPHPPLDHGGRDAEAGRDVLGGHVLVLDEGTEGLELIVGVHRAAQRVLGEREFLGVLAVGQDAAGDCGVLVQPAGFRERL